MESIISVHELKKSYGQIEAVKGLSFQVGKGQLFAFLGPNGAGKSTTIDILCTLLKPDEGEIRIGEWQLGKDDTEIKKRIGVVFQEGVLDPLLTVKENLKIRGSLYAIPKAELKKIIDDVAVKTGILEFLDRPYGKLSGGQKRRADIARGLLNKPDILFLDEPTTGLDPQTRRNVWDTISQLQKETGMTIFLTTHYMEEADKADYIVVVDNGAVAAQGTPENLKERFSSDILKIHSASPSTIESYLHTQLIPYKVEKGTIQVSLKQTLDAIPILEEFKGIIDSFEVHTGTMDDVFIGITGKEMRE